VIITILTSAKYKLCLNFNSFCINPKLIKNNTIVLFNSGYLVTFIGILLARKRIQKIAQYIVGSPLYYITYILLIIGFIIELI
ncbi:hypothetical protein P5752_27715, partial [Bacillus cereus]